MGDDDEDEEQKPVNSQISTREPPSDLSMGDDDDIEIEPVRKPVTSTASSAPVAAAMPAESPGEDGQTIGANELGVSLDEFWQDLKDELQKRHMPTFAIMQTHAFILAFEKSDIVIGVRRENFQKLLELKADHIKTAAKALLGRTVTTRIKVVADPAPAPPKPKAANTREHQSSPGSSEDPERAKANQSSSDSENSRHSPSSQDERPRAPAQPASALHSARPGAPASPAQNRPQDPNAPSRVTTRNDELPPEGNLLKEAYKLFEGPGSRLIG